MTWLDIAILAILALSAIFGLVRGFIKEMLSLVVWVLSFWVAFRYKSAVAVYLENYIEYENARLVAAFVLLFLAVVLIGMVVSGLLVRIARSSGVGGPDRTLGALFGLLRGALVVTLLVLVTGITPLAESQAWADSSLMNYFETLADWASDAVRRGTGVDIPVPGAETPPHSPSGG